MLGSYDDVTPRQFFNVQVRPFEISPRATTAIQKCLLHNWRAAHNTPCAILSTLPLTCAFPFPPVGHRVQEEMGFSGYQAGGCGQRCQHRLRSCALGHTLSCESLFILAKGRGFVFLWDVCAHGLLFHYFACANYDLGLSFGQEWSQQSCNTLGFYMCPSAVIRSCLFSAHSIPCTRGTMCTCAAMTSTYRTTWWSWFPGETQRQKKNTPHLVLLDSRPAIELHVCVAILPYRAVQHPRVPETQEFVRVHSYQSKMVIRPHKSFDEVCNIYWVCTLASVFCTHRVSFVLFFSLLEWVWLPADLQR